MCPFRKGAIVFRDLCTIGYYQQKNLSLPLDPSMDIIARNIDTSEVLIKGSLFDHAVVTLARAVADAATMSSSHYETGQMEVDTVDFTVTIYAVAQCWPLISADACRGCLADLIDAVGSAELTAGRAATLQCNYRFGLYQFFSGEPTLSLPIERSHGELTVRITEFVVTDFPFCGAICI